MFEYILLDIRLVYCCLLQLCPAHLRRALCLNFLHISSLIFRTRNFSPICTRKNLAHFTKAHFIVHERTLFRHAFFCFLFLGFVVLHFLFTQLKSVTLCEHPAGCGQVNIMCIGNTQCWPWRMPCSPPMPSRDCGAHNLMPKWMWNSTVARLTLPQVLCSPLFFAPHINIAQ